jgi:hypothetical protein
VTHQMRDTPRVVLVKYRPDPNSLRHGPVPKIEYQAKIVGVNGQTKWLDYAHTESRHGRKEAEWWAGLLGVEVEELDISDLTGQDHVR